MTDTVHQRRHPDAVGPIAEALVRAPDPVALAAVLPTALVRSASRDLSYRSRHTIERLPMVAGGAVVAIIAASGLNVDWSTITAGDAALLNAPAPAAVLVVLLWLIAAGLGIRVISRIVRAVRDHRTHRRLNLALDQLGDTQRTQEPVLS